LIETSVCSQVTVRGPFGPVARREAVLRTLA